jgi:hypothetical protein
VGKDDESLDWRGIIFAVTALGFLWFAVPEDPEDLNWAHYVLSISFMLGTYHFSYAFGRWEAQHEHRKEKNGKS